MTAGHADSVSAWVSAALEDRGPRHARLSMALGGIEVMALDEPLGRAAGRLLGAAGMSDVVDAALVLLANDGDEIVTIDCSDIETLASTSGRHVELIHP